MGREQNSRTACSLYLCSWWPWGWGMVKRQFLMVSEGLGQLLLNVEEDSLEAAKDVLRSACLSWLCRLGRTVPTMMSLSRSAQMPPAPAAPPLPSRRHSLMTGPATIWRSGGPVTWGTVRGRNLRWRRGWG